MIFDVITIFPNILDSYYRESILGRAIKSGKIKINYINLRDFTNDKRKTVDDCPYGGGAGMILKVEPIVKALQSINKNKKTKIILLDPKGKIYNQKIASEYSRLDKLVFINGYYEGVDTRIENFVDEKISLGNYVLTNSELAGAIIIDSVSRLIPGVLGNEESLKDESYNDDCLEYPQYTRPEIFKYGRKKFEVPSVLLSGNHGEIEKWKSNNQDPKNICLPAGRNNG